MDRECLNQSLSKATVCRNIETVRDCLSKGADINESDRDGWNPLHIAASKGYLELVELFLEKTDAECNVPSVDGDTPLHLAVCGGHLDIVQLLLDRTDIDPNRENKSGNTPLHSGVCYDHFDIFQLILKQVDIDPNRGNKYKSTPLQLAVSGGRIHMVKCLLEREDTDQNKETEDGDTPLHSAVSIGHITITKLLLEREDTDPNKQNQSGNTPLHYAVKNERVEIVKLLLKRVDIQKYKVNKYGDTPFDIATNKKRNDLYGLLLERTTTDEKWNATLTIADRSGKLDTVQSVHEPSSLDPILKTEHSDTLLHSVVLCGDFQMTQHLLKQKDTDVNKGDTTGNTPLHLSIRKRHIQIVQLLLGRKDVDTNKKNETGNTPLHLSIQERHIQIVQLLLGRKDVDTNKTNEEGNTPLHLSILIENIEIMQLCLERADVDPNKKNKCDETPLHLAVLLGHPGIVRLLLQRKDVDPNKRCKSDGTILHSAVLKGHPGIVRLLLERSDVNPNTKNKSGETPLYSAILKEDFKIIQALLERNDVDVNEKNKNGETPLHSATRNGNFQMVLLLLGRTDVLTNETNMHNQTPTHVLEAQTWVSEEDKKRMKAVRDLIKFHGLGFPAELRTLDKDSAKLFTHLLEEESYPHFESRVMLAGEQGTGKTTIARYLIGKGPTRMRKSTDGIGLYTGLSYIDRETDEWLDGKQDFSLAELTISRSLRQTPLGLPVSSLSPKVSNNSANTHDSKLIADGSVRFKEHLEGNKDRYKMTDGPYEREKNNIGLKEQANCSILTHNISDYSSSTDNPPGLDTLQGDSNDKKIESKISFGHPQIDTPVQNVNLENLILQSHLQSETEMTNDSLDLDKTKCHFKDERLVHDVLVDQQEDSTNVPQGLNIEQDNQEDKTNWPKALLHIDEHLAHPLDIRPVPNVHFDPDTQERKSKKDQCVYHEEKRDDKGCRPMQDTLFAKENENEKVQDRVPNSESEIDRQHRDLHNKNATKRDLLSYSDRHKYSKDDTSWKESDDVTEVLPMTVHQTNAKTVDKSHAYKTNIVPPLLTSSKKDSSILEQMELVQERIDTLQKSTEVEKAPSGFNTSIESVTNPGLITQLKRLFGVSKKVEEIKVSITEEHILQQSLIVGKKKLHRRHIAPVIIWDFGGQDIFYSTHQSFLSYRAIYLIVLDGSRTLDDPCQFTQYLPGKSGSKTARDYLRFWINTIVTYCRGREHGFPKIMVVFTHKDKLKPSEVETRREQLFGDVKRMFHGSALMPHLVIKDNIFVNARNKNDPEMTKIKTVIIRESKRQPTWGQNLPKCFIPLELEIEKLIQKGINVITIGDLRNINTHHPIRPLTDAELKVFLKFQHAIGKILYFDEPGLDTHITLLPTYLIDAFKSIITDKSFCKGEKQREDLWSLMSQKGVISKVAIEELWKNSKYRRFEQRKDYLLAVMTHLDILVEPRRYDPKHNRIPADFYYVASMVQAIDTTGYIQSPSLSERSIAVSFSSNDAIIPPALSFRFITYCLSIFDVKKYGDRNDEMLFHRSAVFTIEPSLDIHIFCEDERIFVRLVHARKKVLIMRDLASSICECLKSALQNISKLYIKSSSDTCDVYTGSFELNFCCSDVDSPCLLPMDEFDSIGGIWICPKHKMEHERFILSRWIKEEKTGITCGVNCPVTSEEFLNEVPSALHLRRLSIICNIDEIGEMVTHLGLSSVVWGDYHQLHTEPELLKFKALCLCHEKSALTFRKIKNAIKELPFQVPHILCEVMKGDSVDFKTDPEKWDLVPTDEGIDKIAPLIGNKSLLFLVELGMDLEIWATINYRQTKRDLVQLNKDILDEWKNTFCTKNNIKPTLRMIAQAYKHIGNDIKVIEHTLFN